MNLIEAIKSGKPFRRKGQEVHSESGFFTLLEDSSQLTLFRDSLLADDWEIQEPTVTITASQFWEAVDATSRLFWPDPAAKCLAEKLGLEPKP